MTELVVDASVALKWFVPEVDGDAARRLLTSGVTLHAPRFLAVETINAAWKNWRKQLIGEDVVGGVSGKIEALIDVWHVDETLLREATDLARGLNHPLFDCLYLVLAKRLGAKVVTADKRLLGVAPAGLTVALADWRP